MPPLSNITLMQPVSTSLDAPPPISARRFRSLSMGSASSAELCSCLISETMNPPSFAPTKMMETKQPAEETTTKQRHKVSFNPRVRVIETHYVVDEHHSVEGKHKASIFDPSTTWYTNQEIDEFQKHAFRCIRRFQRSWQMSKDECLRGLESQTTKCTATKVRIHVYKDLLLAKKDATKRLVTKSPQKVRHMMCVILRASEQDALELAQMDALEAEKYQQNLPDSESEEEGFKCFLWDLPRWLVPKNNKTPAIVDVPI